MFSFCLDYHCGMNSFSFLSSDIKDYLGHTPAETPKKQKNPLQKKFFIFSDMELSSSNTKKILTFSQKIRFPIFSQR